MYDWKSSRPVVSLNIEEPIVAKPAFDIFMNLPLSWANSFGLGFIAL